MIHTSIKNVFLKHDFKCVPYAQKCSYSHFLMLPLKAVQCCHVIEMVPFSQGTYHGTFDFIFVDADKDNYLNYHERLIELVKVGGLIGYDNTLWNGSVVAPPDAPLRKYVRFYRDYVLELNRALASDRRVEICQLPVGDGITLCRRIS